MRRPILLLIIMAVSFSQSDITSPSILSGVIYPLLFAAATLVLLIWLIHRFNKNHKGGDGGSEDGGGIYTGKSADAGDAGGDGGGGGGD